jgi:hypothetical protein
MPDSAIETEINPIEIAVQFVCIHLFMTQLGLQLHQIIIDYFMAFLAHLAKVNVSFCHHLASVVRRLSSVNFSHFNLLL